MGAAADAALIHRSAESRRQVGCGSCRPDRVRTAYPGVAARAAGAGRKISCPDSDLVQYYHLTTPMAPIDPWTYQIIRRIGYSPCSSFSRRGSTPSSTCAVVSTGEGARRLSHGKRSRAADPPCLVTARRGEKGVTLVNGEAFQVAAVAVVVIAWCSADGYSRRMRRKARRYRIEQIESQEQSQELLDAQAPSASDD